MREIAVVSVFLRPTAAVPKVNGKTPTDFKKNRIGPLGCTQVLVLEKRMYNVGCFLQHMIRSNPFSALKLFTLMLGYLWQTAS